MGDATLRAGAIAWVLSVHLALHNLRTLAAEPALAANCRAVLFADVNALMAGSAGADAAAAAGLLLQPQGQSAAAAQSLRSALWAIRPLPSPYDGPHTLEISPITRVITLIPITQAGSHSLITKTRGK